MNSGTATDKRFHLGPFFTAGMIAAGSCTAYAFDSASDFLEVEQPAGWQHSANNLTAFSALADDEWDLSGPSFTGVGAALEGAETASLTERSDAVLEQIMAIAKLGDGWDGPGSIGPAPELIRDAVVVAQKWPADLPLPDADVTVDGHVVLELFDAADIAIGSIEFSGGGEMIFVVVEDSQIVASGSKNSRSSADILSMFREISEKTT